MLVSSPRNCASSARSMILRTPMDPAIPLRECAELANDSTFPSSRASSMARVCFSLSRTKTQTRFWMNFCEDPIFSSSLTTESEIMPESSMESGAVSSCVSGVSVTTGVIARKASNTFRIWNGLVRNPCMPTSSHFLRVSTIASAVSAIIGVGFATPRAR